MSNTVIVFGMSAEEVGELITYYLGKGLRLDILRVVEREIGKAKIAQAAGVVVPTISKVFERNSLGDKLSKKIFTGLAREYPEVLKMAIEVVVEKHRKELDGTIFAEFLDMLIGKKKEKIKESLSKPG